jgi:hypothetical protein
VKPDEYTGPADKLASWLVLGVLTLLLVASEVFSQWR